VGRCTPAGACLIWAPAAGGRLAHPKDRETGLARLHQAGVIVSDYASLVVEMLADNAHPIAPHVYEDLDMPFGTLVGQFVAARSR
jgi:hypothetical protein